MEPSYRIDTGIPLIDLHRHLDGSVRLETVIELADQQGIELPAHDVESLRPYVVIEGRAASLMDFIGRFRYLTAVLHDLDAAADHMVSTMATGKLKKDHLCQNMQKEKTGRTFSGGLWIYYMRHT